MRPTTKSAQRRAPPGRAPRIVPISSFRCAIRLKRDGRRHGDTGWRSPRRSSIEMQQACAVRRGVGHRRRTSRRARQPAGARAVLRRFRHGAPRRPCVIGQRSSGEPPNVLGRCLPAARRQHTAASPFARAAAPAPSPFAAAHRARRMNGRRPRRSSGSAARRPAPRRRPHRPRYIPGDTRMPAAGNAHPTVPLSRSAAASAAPAGSRIRTRRRSSRPSRSSSITGPPAPASVPTSCSSTTKADAPLSAPFHSGRTQCARRRISQGTPCNSQASS